MQLINEIMADLKETAEELATNSISSEEFNLKVDLMIERINRIEINFLDCKINNYHPIFDRLLAKTKFRATEVLQELQKNQEKRGFNSRVRRILAAHLYFKPIQRTVQRNMIGYQSAYGYKLKDNIQLFIEKEITEND